MRRRTILGIAGLGAALCAIPATVGLAQGVPPGPPQTFYGSAAGATPGGGVVAIIGSSTCGTGVITTDNGSPVYVIDVVSDSQTPGCGAAGRTISFYFSPTGGQPGRLANETATWSAAGPKQQALTPGKPLTERRFVPMAASDGYQP